MSARSATLVSSAAALALVALATAAPALAQDRQLPNQTAIHEGSWDGTWVDQDTWQGRWQGTYTDLDGRVSEGSFAGTFTGDHSFTATSGRTLVQDRHRGWREAPESGQHTASPRYYRMSQGDGMVEYPGQPVLGYSPAQREAWLADCRSVQLDGAYFGWDQRERRNSGGLIGGVLGAVAGGVLGNRVIADDRLAGTLIGAGVGGLAGLAIGSLLGAGSRDRARERQEALLREEAIATRYCAAYLQRYEAGGFGQVYGQPLQAQPMMLVPVTLAPMMQHHGDGMPLRTQRPCTQCRQIIEEEQLDIPAVEPTRPARRAITPASAPAPALAPARAPAPTKRVPAK